MPTLNLPFTGPANRVLNKAQQMAESQNHSAVEPQHLLMALLQEEKGLAYFILKGLNTNLAALKEELQQSLEQLPPSTGGKVELSPDSRKVIELSVQSAGVIERAYLGTEHLLVGLLRHIHSPAYPILRRANVNYNEVLVMIRKLPPEMAGGRGRAPDVAAGERLTLLALLRMISPVFLLLVMLMGFSAAAAWFRWIDGGVAVFMMVAIGWVVSLSLHEFGHALAAYLGGDYSVVNKGYLTLNPLRYTHGTLSILFPLLILIMGGIGLPGGAVYINYHAIQGRAKRALVAAAGPLMTLAFTVVVAFPFFLGLSADSFFSHIEFWSGLALLAFLQITALAFNLLPIPPLDGYGILRPYLPESITRSVQSFGRFSFWLIFLVFMIPNPIRDVFWIVIGTAVNLLGINLNLVLYGLDMFRFWG